MRFPHRLLTQLPSSAVCGINGIKSDVIGTSTADDPSADLPSKAKNPEWSQGALPRNFPAPLRETLGGSRRKGSDVFDTLTARSGS